MKKKKLIYLIFKILISLILIITSFDLQLLISNINFFRKKKSIIIEIDVSGAKLSPRGPSHFIKGMKELLPYKTKFCTFIPSERIYPINGRNESNFYYLPYPRLSESIYEQWVNISKAKNLLLGPIFVPNRWNKFPNKNIWNERRFRELLKSIKGVVVHSDRVRSYLSKRSNTMDLNAKYKIVRPCTNLNPKKINSFDNRKIDIIFFEKYGDLNRKKQAIHLLKLFNNSTLKIEKLIYGNYTKKQMIKLANNSKFIIYFSFFDTGAIGLKEIQNFGVIAFSHQKDLIINKRTSFYIPELTNIYDMKKAFNHIIKIIKDFKNKKPNTKLIAKINQDINKCHNALNDLCKSIL